MAHQQTGRIVVGYDGTETSGFAVDWAAAEAARRGSELRVLSVAELPTGLAPGSAGAWPWSAETATAAAQALADEGAVRAGKVADESRVTTRAVAGPVASSLVEASAEAELVVLGTRGHRPIGEAVLGSVCFAVTAHSACPVVVVHEAPRQPLDPAAPVVVGVDASPASADALEFAATTARTAAAPLRVLTAWRPPAAQSWALTFYEHAPQGDPGEQARIRAARLLAEGADHASDAAQERLRRDFPDVDATFDVVAGDPRTVLAEASAGARLLVVGARGRGGFTGLLLGSVSHALLRAAHSLVAVVRG